MLISYWTSLLQVRCFIEQSLSDLKKVWAKRIEYTLSIACPCNKGGCHLLAFSKCMNQDTIVCELRSHINTMEIKREFCCEVGKLHSHVFLYKSPFHDFNILCWWHSSVDTDNVEGPFCDPNMLYLWHISVDIDKISLLSNWFWGCVCELCSFYWIVLLHRPLYATIGNYYVDIINRLFGRLFRQTN